MMSRYFMEVSYKGTGYAGFQVQKNANTIQAEIEKALRIYFRVDITLTGSSRTDTGVHALQNYFHFDFDASTQAAMDKAAYRLNAILPREIVVQKISMVHEQAHCRFDVRYRPMPIVSTRLRIPFLRIPVITIPMNSTSVCSMKQREC